MQKAIKIIFNHFGAGMCVRRIISENSREAILHAKRLGKDVYRYAP
jgi:hypothetical protein